ncbi:MAG: DEAD/DEAH box helicase [Candidatus Bathyarchaeia archaeon]
MGDEDVFSLLCKPVRRLIEERGFTEPTEPQRRAIPLILRGENVLLISPTATGKTEAAFLPVLHLYLTSEEKKPGIKILYITPLRALNRDILDRLTWWCTELDLDVAVRHGDSSTIERTRQRRSPPDMLITTPETLQAVLLGRVIRRYLRSVRWVIVDEIHELADNKRGSQLSLALERLREVTDEEFQIVGLSATIGSPEKVGAFLVGAGRPAEVIRVPVARATELKIVYPEPEAEDYELAERLYTRPEVAARLRVMRDLIEGERTTLLFTNTRAISEVLASRFKVWDMDFPLSIHHGSLAKPSRIAAETGLKSGDLRTVVCTSSLELGIDIGHIDLTIQYMSPRQVTRLLQRVGRSGHRLGRVAKGVIVTMDSDDTLESMVICRKALVEDLEPVEVPDKPYDVLINQIIAELMPLGRRYFYQILKVFKGAYPFRDLDEEDLRFVGKYMHNRFPRLAWLSPEDQLFLKPRSSRSTIYNYFFSNLSMIPDEKDYLVLNEEDETPLGILHEAFVAEYGRPGVKFIIRGSPWRILDVHEDKIYVKPEEDPTGAIPNWVGEEIPVPLEVASEVGGIKGLVEDGVLEGRDVEEVVEELAAVYPADPWTISKAISEIVEHVERGLPVPTDRRVVLEDWEENIIVHANFGSLVNRTLARLIGHLISEETGYPVAVQQDPYRVVAQAVGGLESSWVAERLRHLAERNLEAILRSAVVKTGLFKRRLIHVARKAGALSKYANFSNITLERLIKSFEDTAIFEEAMKDTLRKDMDIEGTKVILEKMSRGEIEVTRIETSGEISPLGKVGLEQVKFKTDIVPPEQMTRIILESAKARLLNESRTLACFDCHKYIDVMRIKDLPDEILCPACGSTRLGVLTRDEEEVRKVFGREERGASIKEGWWTRAKRSAELVSTYGKRAAVVLSGRRISLKDALEILEGAEDLSDQFFERILEAERKALKRRFL